MIGALIIQYWNSAELEEWKDFYLIVESFENKMVLLFLGTEKRPPTNMDLDDN